jgi:hypothetical protein
MQVSQVVVGTSGEKLAEELVNMLRVSSLGTHFIRLSDHGVEG